MASKGHPLLITLILTAVSTQMVAGSTTTTLQAFSDTMGDINYILYGIAAGIAILLIVIHGVKYKTTDNPDVRENAKRGIINVVIGLAIIIIAAALVSMMF
ncbi:MAG: TrbC/VirB2 family protein [Candidatus Altiarchaeales archaeon]|nr:TrbC/VirB2 family protein [Candidatus Altiarchaeales archaeon]